MYKNFRPTPKQIIWILASIALIIIAVGIYFKNKEIILVGCIATSIAFLFGFDNIINCLIIKIPCINKEDNHEIYFIKAALLLSLILICLCFIQTEYSNPIALILSPLLSDYILKFKEEYTKIDNNTDSK